MCYTGKKEKAQEARERSQASFCMARLTTAQKTGSAADRAARARGEMDSYMRKLRDQSNKTRKAAESKAFSNAFVSAQKSGALEVTVNGKTYRRANKRSGTWRPV